MKAAIFSRVKIRSRDGLSSPFRLLSRVPFFNSKLLIELFIFGLVHFCIFNYSNDYVRDSGLRSDTSI